MGQIGDSITYSSAFLRSTLLRGPRDNETGHDYYKLILYYQPTGWLGTLISLDGSHPSAGGGGRDFSLAGLSATDGCAARAKLALDMAEKLRAIVFLDGEPEPAALFMDAFESGDASAWSPGVP